MARTRGTGNLQQEKNGTWTLRVGWKGRRLSRSTGTTDRARAEKALAKFLAPLGGGERHLALADAIAVCPGSRAVCVGAVYRDFHRGAAKATPAPFPSGTCDRCGVRRASPQDACDALTSACCEGIWDANAIGNTRHCLASIVLV